jgi:hypothetical protein
VHHAGRVGIVSKAYDEDRVTVALAHETAGVGMFVQTDPVRLTLTDLMELKSIIETRGEPI